MNTKKEIRKIALENAIKYKGKAALGAVVGKTLAIFKNKKPTEVIPIVNEIVKEINNLTLEEQQKEFESLGGKKEEKKHEEHDLFAFLKIKHGEKIITAFPPEPSKYPHIGHAKAIFLNYELAKKYNGKFILRFEDTNPVLAKKEFYNIHLENYSWLGIIPDKIDYASDHMREFYKYAEILIKKDKAYCCTCSQEIIKKNRFNGIACDCRSRSLDENLKLWKKMPEMKENSVIVRLKIDLKHQNTTMRDPTIFRIIKAAHPRLKKKFKVWPNYDFENSVMDGLEGITHRLRTKEFELRAELQHYIQKSLGFKETFSYEFARFNLEGTESSGRIIREKIKNKEILGWDDPSLTTLVALKRRGFLPEAIKEFVLSTGISKAESTLQWDDLIMHNKRLLDSKANRYFFVENPKKITIKNAPSIAAEVPLHPDFPERGYRLLNTERNFYIQDNLEKGKPYRFMHLFNFQDNLFISQGYNQDLGAKLIHWLPVTKELIHIEIVMPDSSIKKGLAESSIKKLKIGSIIQFERFAFCILDRKKDKKFIFYFTHH